MQAAAGSMALSWLMVLVVTPIWLALWCDTSKLADGWRMLEAHSSSIASWVLVPLTLAVAMALTWRWLVVSLYQGLWGRPTLFIWRAAVCFLGGWVGLIVLAHTVDHAKQLKQWLEAGRYLAILVLLKGVLSTWAFRSAHRRGLLSGRAIVAYLAIWAGAVLCLATFGWLTLANTSVPKPVIILGALLLFPLVRIGVAPLALKVSRHR
jgi:hypothetical protein